MPYRLFDGRISDEKLTARWTVDGKRRPSWRS
jgi:hypothetical protein